MAAIDERERLMADSQFGAGALTANAVALTPATWYLGLSTTSPNEDGTNFTEPVGGAYARVAVTNNVTNFPPAQTTAGVTTKRKGVALIFPNPTGLWGNIGWFGWFTVATVGTGLPQFHNPLDTPITVQNGNTPVQFDVSQLIMSWD